MQFMSLCKRERCTFLIHDAGGQEPKELLNISLACLDNPLDPKSAPHKEYGRSQKV